MAEALAPDSSDEQRAVLDQRFRRLAFRNPVPPNTTTSGFVLTNLDEGVKLVQVGVVASRRVRTFSMLTVVLGFRADYKVSKAFQTEIYPPAKITNYTDSAAFRAALQSLPCCVTNKESTKNGDPLNLVIVGGLEDAFPTLVDVTGIRLRRSGRARSDEW